MATIEEYLKEVDTLAELKQCEGYSPSVRPQFLANFYDSIWTNEPARARKIFLLLLKQYTEKRIYLSSAKKITQKTIQSIIEEFQATYKTDLPDKLPRIIEKINAKKDNITLKGRLACLLSAYVTRFPRAKAYFCEDIQKELTLPKVEDEKIQPKESKAAEKNMVEMPIEQKIQGYKELCDTPDNMVDSINAELFHHIKVTSDGNLYSKQSLDDLFTSWAAEHKHDPLPHCAFNRKKLSKETDYQDAKELDAICHEFDIEQKTIMLIIDELPGVSEEDVMANITLFQKKRDALSKRFTEKHEEIQNSLLLNKKNYFGSMIPIPDELLCHKSKEFLTEPVINNDFEVVNLSSLPDEKMEICEPLKSLCESYQEKYQAVRDAINKFNRGDNEEKVIELIGNFNSESQLILLSFSISKLGVINHQLKIMANTAFGELVRTLGSTTNKFCRTVTLSVNHDGETALLERNVDDSMLTDYTRLKLQEFNLFYQQYQNEPQNRQSCLNKILNLFIQVSKKNESYIKRMRAAEFSLYQRAIDQFCTPKELLCPRTRKVLVDPVLTPEGEIVSLAALTNNEIEAKKCKRLSSLDGACKTYLERRKIMYNKTLALCFSGAKSFQDEFDKFIKLTKDMWAELTAARNAVDLESKPDNSLITKMQIISNLKLDIKNESHLVFWSRQVSKKYCGHGGTTVAFCSVDGSVRNYNVPKRVYKMMLKASQADDLTLNQFAQELEGARASRSGFFRNPLVFVRKAPVVEKVYSVGNDIRVLRV